MIKRILEKVSRYREVIRKNIKVNENNNDRCNKVEEDRKEGFSKRDNNFH